MGKRCIAVAVMAACLIFGVAAQGKGEESASGAAPQYKLRFGHVLTPEDEFNKGMLRWADAVKEKTDGNLTIEVYPSGQLGVEEDVLEQIRQGTNVGWQTDPARLGNYVKEWSIFYAPFFFSSLDDIKALLDSPEIAKWADTLEKEHGIKVLSYAWAQGFRNIMASGTCAFPEELKGMLIRTANAPMWLATVNSLGCKAVALGYGDIYNGIQTKVVDGCELPFAAAKSLRINEVAKYIIETRHIFACNAMVVSAKWYDSLPPEYQKILVDECNKAGLASSETLIKNSDADCQYLVDHGMTLIPHDELDMDAFIESSMQAYQKMGLEETRNKIYKELGK